MSNHQTDHLYTERSDLSIGKPLLVINKEDMLLVKKVREFLENNGFDHSRWPDEDIIHILREKSNPRMEVMAAAAYIMDADYLPDQWMTVKSKKVTKSEKKVVQENPKKNMRLTHNNNIQKRNDRNNQNDKQGQSNNTQKRHHQTPFRKKIPTQDKERLNDDKPNLNNNEKSTVEKKPKKEYKGWEVKNNSYRNNENVPKQNYENSQTESKVNDLHHQSEPTHLMETETYEEPKPKKDYTQTSHNLNIQSSQVNTKQNGPTKVVMPSFEISSNEDIHVQFGGPISSMPSEQQQQPQQQNLQQQQQPKIHMPQPQNFQILPAPIDSPKSGDQGTNEKIVGNPPPGGFTIPTYMTHSQPGFNQMPFIPTTQGYVSYPFDDQRMNFYGFDTNYQIPTYHMHPNNLNSNVNNVGTETTQTTRSSTNNTQEKTQNTGKQNQFYSNGGNPAPFTYYNPYMNYVIPQNTTFPQYNVQGQSNQHMRYNNNNYGKQRNQFNSEDSYNAQ